MTQRRPPQLRLVDQDVPFDPYEIDPYEIDPETLPPPADNRAGNEVDLAPSLLVRFNLQIRRHVVSALIGVFRR